MEWLNTFLILKYALCMQLLEGGREGEEWKGEKGKEGGRRKWVIFNKCDGTIKYPIWIKCIVGPLSYTIYKNKFQRERRAGEGAADRERERYLPTTDQEGFHGYAKWEKQVQRNDVACNFYRNNKLFCKRMGKTWKDIYIYIMFLTFFFNLGRRKREGKEMGGRIWCRVTPLIFSLPNFSLFQWSQTLFNFVLAPNLKFQLQNKAIS